MFLLSAVRRFLAYAYIPKFMSLHGRPWPNSMFPVLSLSIILAGATVDTTSIANESASTTTLPTLESGAKVRNFYQLVASGDDATCHAFLDAINIEKTYYVHDERDVTLGTRFNLTWDISVPDDDWTLPTAGSWRGHRVSYREFSEGDGWQETTATDLDNDGQIDQVYRWTRRFKSQNHSTLILLDKPARTASDARFLGGYQDEHGSWHPRNTERDVLTAEMARKIMPEAGDFFLMDVAELEGRNFFIAANMLRPPEDPVQTFVIQLHADRRVEIVCHLQARYLIR